MDVPAIALPAALLFVAYLLRLLVDHQVSLADLIEATIELPVEIAFLATSFVVAFTISTPLRVRESINVRYLHHWLHCSRIPMEAIPQGP